MGTTTHLVILVLTLLIETTPYPDLDIPPARKPGNMSKTANIKKRNAIKATPLDARFSAVGMIGSDSVMKFYFPAFWR